KPSVVPHWADADGGGAQPLPLAARGGDAQLVGALAPRTAFDNPLARQPWRPRHLVMIMAPLAQVAGEVVKPELRWWEAAHRGGAADVFVVIGQQVARRGIAPRVRALRFVVRCKGFPLLRQWQSSAELLADPQRA